MILIIISVLLRTYALIHARYCNMAVQLTHDARTQFDHLQFPGVVPRTWLGALGLFAVSWPFRLVLDMRGLSLQIAGTHFLQCTLRRTPH